MPAFSASAVATAATAVGVADMGAAGAGAGAVLTGGAGTLAGGAEAGALATGAFSSDFPQPAATTSAATTIEQRVNVAARGILFIIAPRLLTPSSLFWLGWTRLLVCQLNFDQETAPWRDLDVLTPHSHAGPP